MSKNALVIMAAGLGSRYGGGIKQMEPVGPAGEIIVDYSIHDAIEAGFQKVVFIIRKDIEKDFKEIIGKRVEKRIETEYVIQSVEDLPEGYTKPSGRTKPWGTGQAVLSCLSVLKEPFAVINADDYYGKEAFQVVSEFLSHSVEQRKDGRYHFCMAGFDLGNTLSENGSVTRGICKVSQEGLLQDVKETSGIYKSGDHAIGIYKENEVHIPLNSVVSMNMWGVTPEFLQELKERFPVFLDGIEGREGKAEFLLPDIMDQLVKEGKTDIQVLRSGDKWFGVTYQEDKAYVMKAFGQLIEQGVYPDNLYQE